MLIPIVLRDEPTVLLTLRTDHLTDHPSQISFPGGRSEPGDDDAVATALREAEEEIGLAADWIEVLGRLPIYTTSTGFIVTPVVALVSPGFALRPDPFEVAEVFEVPLAWLMNPANHQRHAIETGGCAASSSRCRGPAPTPRAAAPLLHLGRDRGDAAQSLSLPLRVRTRAAARAAAKTPPV